MLAQPKKIKKFKKSEKGMALIESIPVLFMLVMIFNFSLGFFGAIHSGILNSIGSYNYAIETFRYRSNLVYFRPGLENIPHHYKIAKNRVHGVVQDGSAPTTKEEKNVWPVTIRPITFNFNKNNSNKSLSKAGGDDASSLCDIENCRNYNRNPSGTNVWRATSDYVPEDGSTIHTPRIWIKTVYGICLSADCGE